MVLNKALNRFFVFLVLTIISIISSSAVVFVSAEIPPLPSPPPLPLNDYSLITWASPSTAPIGSIVSIYASFTDNSGNFVVSDCVLSINNSYFNMSLDNDSELYFYRTNSLSLGLHYFTVSCSGVFNSSNVTIVPSDNEAPKIEDLGVLRIDEGSLLEFSITASDVDGPELMFSYDSLPEGMVVVSHESSGSGVSEHSDTYSFSWTPDYDQSGTYTIVFMASDSVVSSSRDVVIKVVDSDDPHIPSLPPVPGKPPSSGSSGSSGGSGGSGGKSGGGSGGSGGGSLVFYNSNYNPSSGSLGNCVEHWVCTSWSSCESGFKRRDCTDVNNCGTTDLKPPVVDECVNSVDYCHDGLMDNDEDGIDCGGSCKPCSDRVVDKQVLPVFTKTDFSLNPGDPLIVSIANPSSSVWNDLTLVVDDFKTNIPEIMPGDSVSVDVNIPLDKLLAFNSFKADLFDKNNNLIASDSLFVNLVFPDKPSLIVDVSSEKPVMYVLYDNSGNSKKVVGLEAVVSFLKDGSPFFDDIIGPFKVDPGEKFVRSIELPTAYLTKGSYDVKADFFKQGQLVASSEYSFSLSSGEGFPWRIILLLLLTAFFVWIVYEVIYAFYYKKGFFDIINKYIKFK